VALFAMVGILAGAVATPAPARADAIPVDLELVLAVDISYSMDPDEQQLQRAGYIEALTSPAVMKAIKSGALGRIAVTYVEWADDVDQTILVPWRLIENAADADAVARELAAHPPRRVFRTSISAAIDFSSNLFGTSVYRGERRVIDVSGDGANNQGPYVVNSRDAAVARGIVINGLPLMLKPPNTQLVDLPELDVYYRDCVIGGDGAFLVPVRSKAEIRQAIERKLILEIADLAPRTPHPPVHRTAATLPTDCLIGEKLWRQRLQRNWN
jgi:hypothetical protein